MKEWTNVKEVMLKKAIELSEECQTSEATASMAVLSANLFLINDTLRKIDQKLDSIIAKTDSESFLRVCGAIDTFEQN